MASCPAPPPNGTPLNSRAISTSARRARRLNFQFDLGCLLTLLLLVLPFYHPYLLLSSKLRPMRASMGGGIALVIYMIAFWKFGRMLPGVPVSEGKLFSTIQVRWAGQLAFNGSGFGCIGRGMCVPASASCSAARVEKGGPQGLLGVQQSEMK
jgi:hypothetical protein